jgi:hypothetical protein
MSLALNYKDGDKKNIDKLTAREKTMVVKEVPDLFTYLAYMWFPGSTIAPFHEFATFDDFIHLRGRFASLKSFETWPAAFKRFTQGWLCVIVMVGIIPVYLIPKGRDYVISDEYVNMEGNFLFKAYYQIMTVKGEMWTYYVGFCFMEAGMIASGCGFDFDKQGEKEYNSARSVGIM